MNIPRSVLQSERVEQERSRQTRQSGRLMVPRRPTVIADRAVSLKAPKFWNKCKLYYKKFILPKKIR